jgi:lipid-binding SYLF domain-containing protein
MKSYPVQLGALALICGMLASCGGAEGVEQSPAASAKTAEKKPQETAAKKSEDNPPMGESELEQKAHKAIVMFEQTDPDMKKFFNESKGYVVFPKVAKGGLVIGGAGGKGVVYERGASGTKIIGYSTLSQGSIGLQVGGQVFSEIIFFQTDASLDRFKKGTTEFAGTASAVAASAGASVDAAYENGVAVFTAGESGLMLQASIGGQGFSFDTEE